MIPNIAGISGWHTVLHACMQNSLCLPIVHCPTRVYRQVAFTSDHHQRAWHPWMDDAVRDPHTRTQIGDVVIVDCLASARPIAHTFLI